jgi:thioredoxin-related protein
MLRILTPIVFSFFLFIGISYAQNESSYKPVTEFDPLHDPVKDLKEAVVEAKKSNRRILLDVGGDWCIWCHRLDAFIESNDEIKNYLNKNFILLKINYSKENKNEEFLSKYPEIAGYPHYFVLDKDGKFLHSQNTGDLEQDKGYSNEKMMTFLEKWAANK